MVDNQEYYIKRKNDSDFIRMGDEYLGLLILSFEGFDTVGKPTNVATQKWVNSNKIDVHIPNTIYRDANDIKFNFMFSDRFVDCDVKAEHDRFIHDLISGKFSIKSGYLDIENTFVCLSEYTPSATLIQRPQGSNSITGTITLQKINSVSGEEPPTPPTPKYQDKSVLIIKNGRIAIYPDMGYDALSRVDVDVDVPPPALQEKNVSITQNGTTDIIPDTGFDALSKVRVNVDVARGDPQPSPNAYVRPADRPVKPVLNDNEIYWLFGVQEVSPNDMAMLAVVSSGTYSVNWGDGQISTIHNSNTVAEHIYDYASIPVTPDSRGYKMVWIKLTPTTVGSNITQIDTNQRPSTRPARSSSSIYAPQVFEFYLRASHMTVLNFGAGNDLYTRYYNCEIFGLQENSLTASGASYMCQYMYNLQQIDDLDINNISVGITFFMNGCQSFNGKFPIGVTFANVTSYFMQGCQAYNQPFPAGVTFANVTHAFMSSCYAYNQPFPDGVTFASAISDFMSSCQAYNQPFPAGVTFANVTHAFMYSCYAYNQPFPNGVTFANVTSEFMSNCFTYNQPFPVGVTFANATLDFMSSCQAYNQPFPIGVTFANVTSDFMSSCQAYNQPFPIGVTFANVTHAFMSSCYAYNQPFPDGVTFASAILDFMSSCQAYNQPFPAGVTFANVTSYFMQGCQAYNQLFPAGVTFANVTSNFMQNCRAYNQSLFITRGVTTAFGTGSFNGMYSLTALRIHNWQGVANNSINISYNSMNRNALVAFFNDFPNVVSGTNTVNITGCAGTASLTAPDRAILTNKGYTIIG